MGTNFYVNTGRKERVVCNYGCEHLIDECLHIGKRSGGWKFCLHIIPERGINELDDWNDILRDGEITDEYGNRVSFDEMINIIKNPFVEYRYSNNMMEYGVRIDNVDNLNYYAGNPIGKIKRDDGLDTSSYVLVEGEFC